MKKFFFAALAVATVAFIGCDKKSVNEPENPNDPLAEYPQLESPGYGKVTIALRAPEGTCNGMVAVGAATNWDGSDDWDPSAQDKPFTKVDGTDIGIKSRCLLITEWL